MKVESSNVKHGAAIFLKCLQKQLSPAVCCFDITQHVIAPSGAVVCVGVGVTLLGTKVCKSAPLRAKRQVVRAFFT